MLGLAITSSVRTASTPRSAMAARHNPCARQERPHALVRVRRRRGYDRASVLGRQRARRRYGACLSRVGDVGVGAVFQLRDVWNAVAVAIGSVRCHRVESLLQRGRIVRDKTIATRVGSERCVHRATPPPVAIGVAERAHGAIRKAQIGRDGGRKVGCRARGCGRESDCERHEHDTSDKPLSCHRNA